MIDIIIKKKEMFSFWFGSYHFSLALIAPLILACYHLNIMSVDIQERMKQDIQSFEDLGTLIEQCLDNFQNVILPKLSKTKIKVAQKDGVSKEKVVLKRPLNFNTEESFEERMFLRDFSKSKGRKEEENVDLSDLFDHCLNSYKKQKRSSTVKKTTSSESLKQERSQDEGKNPEEFKAFATSLARQFKARRDLSDNVLDRNFRHQLQHQHKLHSENQKNFHETQNRPISDTFSDFENKQNKRENKKKDAAVSSEKENKIKKSMLENRIRSRRKTQPLQKTMQRKRLLGQ